MADRAIPIEPPVQKPQFALRLPAEGWNQGLALGHHPVHETDRLGFLRGEPIPQQDVLLGPHQAREVDGDGRCFNGGESREQQRAA